jgi:hypothetical protein
MMNLINDGRHAFFGGFCDIVVSKDLDFIEKTKFMYEMHDIRTLVLNINEFQDYLQNCNDESKLSLVDMIEDGNEISDTKIISNENGVLLVGLYNTYFSYFNIVNHVVNENGSYCYYTKYLPNMSMGTLMNEFEMIVNRLSEALGIDVNGNKEFYLKEIDGDNWIGRIWRVGDTIIELNMNGKLYLAFYPIAYLENTKTKLYQSIY